MATAPAHIPRHGVTRNCVLWYRTRTRFERVVCGGGAILVLWALFIIASGPRVVQQGPPGLSQAEVQAVKAQVARQERLKFALEKQEVMNEMAKREKALQAQLQEAKLQKEELDAMLSLAKDANQQDQESLDDLAAKQEEASDKIEQLREALEAARSKAGEEMEGRKKEMHARIQHQTLASLSRHSAQRQAAALLDAFCSGDVDAMATSPIDQPPATDSVSCTGSVVPAHVQPTNGISTSPAVLTSQVAQIHDSTLASQLAHMVVPVLRNTSSAFAGKRVPIAEEISTGRCCDEVTYMAHPSAGMLYRMKLPIVSAAAAAPTSADVAYRSVCFRRPWVAQPPTVAVLDPLKPQRRGSDVSSSADAEGAQRPTVAIIAVLGSRVSHLPWLLRSLRGMAQHAARVRSRVPTRLILVVGNPVDPTSPVGAPLVKNDAQLAEALDQLRANITSFDIHMDVTIVQPLDRSQRTASGVVQAIKQWPGGGGLAPAHDPRGVWAQSPWVAAAVAGFSALSAADDVGVLLDPGVVVVPDDLLLQVATRVKSKVQVLAPIMEWRTGGAGSGGGGLRAGASMEESTPNPAPYVTTLAATQRDMARILHGLMHQAVAAPVSPSADADATIESFDEAIAGTASIASVDCAALHMIDAAEELSLRVARTPVSGLVLSPARGSKHHDQAKTLDEGLQALRATCGCGVSKHASAPAPRCRATGFQTLLDDRAGAFQMACAIAQDHTRSSSSSGSSGSNGAANQIEDNPQSSDGSDALNSVSTTAAAWAAAHPGDDALDAAAPLTHARVVDPSIVHAAMVDNVYRVNTFVDPRVGVLATGIVSDCLAGSNAPATCPAPSTTHHSVKTALTPWVSVEWLLSGTVIPPRAMLDDPESHFAYKVPGADGGGASSPDADDDDYAAVMGGATQDADTTSSLLDWLTGWTSGGTSESTTRP